MLDISDEASQVLKAVRDSGDQGQTFNDLYDDIDCFDQKSELSRAIHQLVQLGLIFKRDGSYFQVDLGSGTAPKKEQSAPAGDYTQEQQQKETKAERYARLVPVMTANAGTDATQQTATPQPKAPKDKPMGSLRRESVPGRLAMALYMYRDEQYNLSIERLVDCLGTQKPSAFYVALSALVAKKYVDSFGYGKDRSLKWSRRFKYPFSRVEEGDESLVKVLPKSMRSEQFLGVAVAPVPSGAAVASVGATVHNAGVVHLIDQAGKAGASAADQQASSSSKGRSRAVQNVLAHLDGIIEEFRKEIEKAEELKAMILGTEEEQAA